MKYLKNVGHLKDMLFFSLIPLLLFAMTAQAKDLLLTVGQQETINAPGVSRIAIGDQNIADVKAIAENDLVLVTAKGVGRTNLIIWGKDNQQTTVAIEVIMTDPK